MASQEGLVPVRKDDLPSEIPRGRARAPSGRSKSRLSPRTTQLSKDKESRVDAKFEENDTNSLNFYRKNWWMSLELARRQFTDLKIKLQAHYNAVFGAEMPPGPGNNGHGMTRVVRTLGVALYDSIWAFYSILVILWRLVWSFIPTPVYILLVMLLLLQIFAVFYTAPTNAILDTFCQYKLPIVSDKTCNSWDPHWPPFDSRKLSIANITGPLDNFLQSRDRTLSNELPSYLDRIQSVIRGYRSSLPQSGYSVKEQDDFGKLFSNFIDQAREASELAIQFNIAFDGTIAYHAIDTSFIVLRLRRDGILVPNHPGVLERAIRRLSTWYLVYLPWGLRPPHSTIGLSTEVRSVSSMVTHVCEMRKRLQNIVELIRGLRTVLSSLETTSELIQKHQVQFKTSSKDKAFQADSKAVRWISWIIDRVRGKKFERWQLERQEEWVANIDFNDFEVKTMFWSRAEAEIGQAYHSSIRLQDLLADEECNKRVGRTLNDAVMEIAMSLDIGIEQQAFRDSRFDKYRTNKPTAK
ncbi:MAG: hypothetical protein Q9168_004634 [Polycauliona sp. 1 TL-2023]